MTYILNTAEVLHDEAGEIANMRGDWIDDRALALTADELREPYIEALAGTGAAEELVWCMTELRGVINELVSNASFERAIARLRPAEQRRANDALRELLRELPREMKRRDEVALEVAEKLHDEGDDDDFTC